MGDNVIVLNIDKKGGGTHPNQNYVSDVLRAAAMVVNSTRNINNWDRYLTASQPNNIEASRFFEMCNSYYLETSVLLSKSFYTLMRGAS